MTPESNSASYIQQITLEAALAVHKATNATRSEHRYAELTFNYHLSTVAQRHSRDMAMRGYVSHESPDGTKPSD